MKVKTKIDLELPPIDLEELNTSLEEWKKDVEKMFNEKMVEDSIVKVEVTEYES